MYTQGLLIDIQSLVTRTSRIPSISGSDLRRILKFISKVIQVVNQSFQDIYAMLIEFKYLKQQEITPSRCEELRKELDLLKVKDNYRDAEQLCNRLHFLHEQYQSQIRPIIRQTTSDNDWFELVRLLQESEGYIIRLVDDTVSKLQGMLSSAMFKPDEVLKINRLAAENAESIRATLTQLEILQNKILGLSGEDGFLELTETHRSEIQEQVNIFYDQSNHNINQTISGSGNISSIGHNVSQSINSIEKQQFSMSDILSLVNNLQNTIEQENLPRSTKERVSRQLDETKSELKEEIPDKDFIANTLKKTTDVIRQAGTLITASSTLGQILLPLAQWLGKSTHWFGL